MAFARTKIQPPRPRSAHVERALMQARLADALLNRRVVLLCAPAVCGKTTAPAHETARLPPEHAMAWISADAGDDLQRLLECMLGARAVRSAVAHGTGISRDAHRPRVDRRAAHAGGGDHQHALPHGWDCGLMMGSATHTFLCGDLFTQGGAGEIPLTESDILGPSEAFRGPMDYYSHAPDTVAILERLAREQPTTLACMHGSAFRGDGAALLRALAQSLSGRHRLRAAA